MKYDFIRERVESLDMYELPEAELSPYVALMITGNVDQELLYRERKRIQDFLDSGKVLVFSGHLSREWLPGAGTFVPKEIRSFQDYEIHKAKDHPIFEGVETKDLTFRRGVAGFFARGHNPPPEGVEVILTLPGGEPVVYVDRRSTRGVIFVSACYDLLGFGLDRLYSDDAPETTASLIAPQLLAWIEKETS
ncbi:phosphate starvation-inducible protein PhoH [Rubrobacter taiwanensis]|uniref:Phosphate starvation-inducible protein PhoH n=1 Tax=Rubrobacter taiwanensis TaxID=185139 RepID=A0A4R1BHG9_9ACTN|nr:phosphate starvation-inducible protein PhoH [Rubrobacter taiwanensis]TCJ16726.1 phosphate starvation-inducible protein PhoH [Rubrobacter taiwanensis]